METILEISGLALTTAVSFTVAWLLGWMALAGLVRLLPASTPCVRLVQPVALAQRVPAASRGCRRARVVVSEARNRSRKMYTVRVA